MDIVLDRESKVPIYLQIKNQIKNMIYSDELQPNYLLPPERKLADQLGVNRSTVLNAYRELKAEGLVDAHIGQGTMVSPLQENRKDSNIKIFPVSWQHMLSHEAYLSNDAALSDVIEMSAKEKVISFAAGIAAPEFYPIEDMMQVKELLNQYGMQPLLHTPIEGLYTLREKICELLLKSINIKATPEEIFILSGSQQGLDLIARNYFDNGDTVIVEEPTYIGALQIFKSIGVKIISVPMTENGMRMDILESLLIKHKPKMIYTIPTFQNPSGKVMDLEHRLKLLELSYTYQIPIIEDDAYGILRYEGEEIPTLKALDQYNHVIYLNTFSKFLFPGLRLGYLYAPKEVIKQFILKKQMMDLHANSLGQWLLYTYLTEKRLKSHLNLIKSEYRARRDAMVQALKQYAPEYVKYEIPEGGFYIWCELPDTFDTSKLWIKAAEEGVVFVSGKVFYAGTQGTNCLRLNFTKPDIADINTGIETLMEVIKKMYKSESGKILTMEINPMF